MRYLQMSHLLSFGRVYLTMSHPQDDRNQEATIYLVCSREQNHFPLNYARETWTNGAQML